MFYTSDSLIASVQRRTLAPFSQPTFQPADILAFANEEMQIKMVPYIHSMKEDYFLRHETTNILANVTKYNLPRRAIGNDVKDVFFVDTSSNRFILPRINIHDLPFNGFLPDIYPNHFYVFGDQLVIAPKPSSANGQIDMWYYQRPSDLVLTANCAKITAITPGGSQVTFTVDTDISHGLSNVDIVSGKSPFQLWVTSTAIVSGAPTSIVMFTADVADETGSTLLPQVGDYICPELQSNIPIIPEEFHPLLAELTAARVLQALGDQAKLQQAVANISEMKINIQTLMANRTEQAAEKLINRYGLNRMSGTGYFTSWVR